MTTQSPMRNFTIVHCVQCDPFYRYGKVKMSEDKKVTDTLPWVANRAFPFGISSSFFSDVYVALIRRKWSLNRSTSIWKWWARYKLVLIHRLLSMRKRASSFTKMEFWFLRANFGLLVFFYCLWSFVVRYMFSFLDASVVIHKIEAFDHAQG